jgi:ribosome biogenesis GTPase
VPDLATLGWDDEWEAAFEPHAREGLVPGRVAVPHRGAYDVLTADGEVRARLPGRTRHRADSTAELPAVGDWVALEAGDEPAIRAMLPRRTRFSRLAAHDPGADATREQVIAANVDLVFIVVPLPDLNLRVLERYLTLAWESGARPVILLTKIDLVPDPPAAAASVSELGDVSVHLVSMRTGSGLDNVRDHVAAGVTTALLGPSGAGKSTLVNILVGEERIATGAVRDDGSGRHTTTRRELVVLPEGGIVIDNPGMRELHLWLAPEGLEEAFADVLELERQCRFPDCSHESEPGCAIQAALADGSLAPERWESFRELERELEELEDRIERRERSRARRGPGAGTS